MVIAHLILKNLLNVNSMKKFTVLLMLLCVLCVNNVNAQDNPCSKYEGRPMPDWVMGATPEPHNNSYYYKVFDSANPDREEARNQAIKKAFQQAMAYISNTVNSADVYEAIAEGRSLNVVSETFSIPIYFTCEFSKKTPDGKQWVYWIYVRLQYVEMSYLNLIRILRNATLTPFGTKKEKIV